MNDHNSKKPATANSNGKTGVRVAMERYAKDNNIDLVDMGSDAFMTPGQITDFIRCLRAVTEEDHARVMQLKSACEAKDRVLMEKWARICTGLDSEVAVR